MHVALFIGGFFLTFDSEFLDCRLKDGEIVGKVPSFTNLSVSYLRWMHFICAVLLLIANINKAYDVEAHVARFLEFVTVPFYVFALMISYDVSNEKIPFVSKNI